MTAAEGLERQRATSRGYGVLWDDALQVCCDRPRCPSVLTCTDPERLDAVASLAGWRRVDTDEPWAVYRCGGCRP